MQQRILFPKKIYSSFCSFKSSLIKVSTSEKSRYTDANRMYATLSSFFSSSNTASPSSSDDTSRSIRDKLQCYFQIRRLETGSDSFTLPFTLSALADYISTDRSAMMRELKRMREEGLVDMEGRRVTLPPQRD